MENTKFPEITKMLDNLSLNIFGRKRSESLSDDTCVMCGEEAIEFRDSLSKKEYGISGLCQKCQDKVFGA